MPCWQYRLYIVLRDNYTLFAAFTGLGQWHAQDKFHLLGQWHAQDTLLAGSVACTREVSRAKREAVMQMAVLVNSFCPLLTLEYP